MTGGVEPNVLNAEDRLREWAEGFDGNVALEPARMWARNALRDLEVLRRRQDKTRKALEAQAASLEWIAAQKGHFRERSDARALAASVASALRAAVSVEQDS